jgi:hypothetical protein
MKQMVKSIELTETSIRHLKKILEYLYHDEELNCAASDPGHIFRSISPLVKTLEKAGIEFKK